MVPQRAVSTSQSWRELTREDTPPLKPMDSSAHMDEPGQSSPDVIESSTLSSQEREQDIVEVPAEPITDTQLNGIGAKLMKAEMMGATGKIEKLKKELEHLRRMKELQEERGKASNESQPREKSHREEKTIVLTKTDRFGRTMPVERSSSSRNRAVPSRTPSHSKKGKRQKYFADDDQYSLKNLIEQERMTTDTRQKGVRNSIPAGLPYFFVDFGLDGGYAHIIEDQLKFPHYFGKEVLGGMLDAEPRLWLKPHRDSFETQKEKVLQLSEWWKPFDWTQKLEK